jgi:hypothetical protein
MTRSADLDTPKRGFEACCDTEATAVYSRQCATSDFASSKISTETSEIGAHNLIKGLLCNV